jgi:hypothetical protein
MGDQPLLPGGAYGSRSVAQCLSERSGCWSCLWRWLPMAGAEARTRSGACPTDPGQGFEQSRLSQSCFGRLGCWRIQDGVSGCWAGDGHPTWAFVYHCVERMSVIVVVVAGPEEGEEMATIDVCCCSRSGLGRSRPDAARGRPDRGQSRLPGCRHSYLHAVKEKRGGKD